MSFPILRSKDGRVERVITSKDELEAFKAQGYTAVRRGRSTDAEEKAAEEKAAADKAAADKAAADKPAS